MGLDAQGFAEAFEGEFRSAIGAEQRIAHASADGRDLDDVSRLLAAHHRQDGLAHGNIAEKVCFKLIANLTELQVFTKPSHAESGVVDQHVDAPVVAYDAVHHPANGVEFGNVEAAEVEFVAHTPLLRGLVESFATAQVTHGGYDPISVLCKFNCCQQSDAAGASRNYRDSLITHSLPPNPSNRQRTAKWFHSRCQVCHASAEYEKITGLQTLHETD